MIWIVPTGLILTNIDAMIIFQFGSTCLEGSKIIAELLVIIAMVSNMHYRYLSKLTLNLIKYDHLIQVFGTLLISISKVVMLGI